MLPQLLALAKLTEQLTDAWNRNKRPQAREGRNWFSCSRKHNRELYHYRLVLEFTQED